jgi:hypothetical protein
MPAERSFDAPSPASATTALATNAAVAASVA